MTLKIKHTSLNAIDSRNHVVPDLAVSEQLIAYLASEASLPCMEDKELFITEFEQQLQSVIDPAKCNFEVIVTSEHDDCYVEVGILNARGNIVSYMGLTQ